MATHSIWSRDLLSVIDGNTNIHYNTFNRGNVAALWTEHSHIGNFHTVVELSTGDIYEFTLVAVGSSNAENITDLWNVLHNGTVVCNRCVGRAYGLDQPVGKNYFKVYMGDSVSYQELWHFTGNIINRFDFWRLTSWRCHGWEKRLYWWTSQIITRLCLSIHLFWIYSRRISLKLIY